MRGLAPDWSACRGEHLDRERHHLFALGVPRTAVDDFEVVGVTRALIEARHWQPEEDAGAQAVVVTVRGDPDGNIDHPQWQEQVRRGTLLDLCAFLPSNPSRWAVRRGSASVLGAVRPQYLSPAPVAVWRDPLAWLRALGEGVVLLTEDRAEMQRILPSFPGGVVAEDADHGRELRSLLERPALVPPVFVRDAARGAA